MADIEEQVTQWRAGVMDKPRRGITRPEYIQQYLDLLHPRIYPVQVELNRWRVRHARYHGPGDYTWVDPRWRRIRLGERWGGPGLTGFFRMTFTVPESMHGRPLMLDIFAGGDGVVSVDGKPVAGLECFHREILLAEKAAAGTAYELEMEICVDHQVTPGPGQTLHDARAVTIDRRVESFYWDLKAAFLTTGHDFADPELSDAVLRIIESVMLVCNPYESDPRRFMHTLRKAQRKLRGELSDLAQGACHGAMTILGHSHLDPVYLWTYPEFQRKILRTHTTQLQLMKEFPDWIFSQSQALLYREIKTLYPAVFREIKQRVAEGRWELLGGMFVEPDCNLISGESLARQFLYGQHFFRREFGVTCRVGWLPDVFGLPQTLPQIMRAAGIDYFYTAKLVWNDTNEWKTHLFWWVAPDGSRILTHTPPLHFIGTLEAPHVMKYQRMLEPKEHVREGIYTYGWGDGGGGVERRMLLTGQRQPYCPGVPEFKSRKAEAYFDEQAERVAPDLPRWHNELYLETHRGTYTSAALLKKLNRRSERILRDAEILSCAALVRTGMRPQVESLRAAWEKVLLNQFHDILPGSHITQGFEDAVRDYRAAIEQAEAVRDRAAQRMAGQPGRDAVHVFNTLLWPRATCIEVDIPPNKAPTDQSDQALCWQPVRGNRRRGLIRTPNLPACGFTVIRWVDADDLRKPGGASMLKVSEKRLENAFIRLRLNTRGEVTSFYDKRLKRDFIPKAEPANQYQLFEDNPGRYDAWDIARVYEKRRWTPGKAERIRIIETGPLRAAIEVTWRLSHSTIRQTYTLTAHDAWVDCRVEIDWREDHRLLKLAWPVNIHAEQATYHIPYGTIQRATHEDTSWDAAKFEVPALMWADLSDYSAGFSLINDGKYGYDIHGHVMRLTCLKASTFPNPTADRHLHTFGFRLYSHPGGWREGETWQAAQDFNTPAAIAWTAADRSRRPEEITSFLEWCGEQPVQLEAWKPAENGRDLIVRIREIFGGANRGRLHLPAETSGAVRVNLLEDVVEPAKRSGNTVQLELNPGEIASLKITLKR